MAYRGMILVRRDKLRISSTPLVTHNRYLRSLETRYSLGVSHMGAVQYLCEFNSTD